MNNFLKKYSFLVVIIFCLAVFLLVRGSEPELRVDNSKIKEVYLAGERISVDLALSNEEHAQGLSGRTNLSPNEGLLFVFENPGRYYFWMKGMNFPIDIIWITEDMKVSYIKENALPTDFLETFGPDSDSKYVLEVVAGFSVEHGLKVGDRVYFSY